MFKPILISTIAAVAFSSVVATSLFAETQQDAFPSIPTTVSPEAGTFLGYLSDPSATSAMPSPDNLEVWEAIQANVIAGTVERTNDVIERFGISVEELTIVGVPVLDVRPDGWADNGNVIVYTHGGGYTLYDAMSSMPSSAAIADATGMRVISIDYTPAPQSRWENTLEQVVSVFGGLLEEGYEMSDIAIYGDSAGGALANGAVLKMRTEGMGMPAAVVLWSPWADIDVTRGDTYETLQDADPLLSIGNFLAPSSLAYADPEDFTHPYVSPVYGDYTKGFPPTLIQGGTKEIFLSNFVRLYQAMDTAGQDVTLDLYEGMPHIFQYLILDSAESKSAIAKTARFMNEHLAESR